MRQGKGMSLVECMIVIGMVGLLIVVALPELGGLVESTRADATMRALATQVALARSTAASTGQRVTFCPSADQQLCAGNWAQGHMIFTDRNGDRRLNQNDRVIRASGPLPAGQTLVWRAFQNRSYLQVEPSGFLRFQSGNFTWCPASADAAHARQLIVSASGRARLAQDTDGDGIQEDSSGRPLRCD